MARELLPTALLFCEIHDRDTPPSLRKLARVSQRRVLRRVHWQSVANEGVAALNGLMGAMGGGSVLSASARQLQCMDGLSETYRASVLWILIFIPLDPLR